MQRQQSLFHQRYDIGDWPIQSQNDVSGRKPAHGGVRVKLPEGVTWIALSQ
jgi:hypothetical protein